MLGRRGIIQGEEIMEPTDAAIEILKSIRNELHDGLTGVRGDVAGVRGEVVGLRGEIREAFGEVTEGLDRLERRRAEADLLLSTELVALAAAIREMRVGS